MTPTVEAIIWVAGTTIYLTGGILFATVITDPYESNKFAKWAYRRRSDEASTVARIGIGIIWPLLSLQAVLYIARGIRDLLPERKPKTKLPEARVL